MIGLPAGKVFLSEWDNEWEVYYESIKAKILEQLGDDINIYHIGSTSVKGLSAKPIIDIAIEIDSFENINKIINGLERIGFDNKGANILSERYYFSDGNPRKYQIHVYEKGNKYLKDQLDFNKILKRNEHILNLYNDLKIKLATQFPDDKFKYTEEKTDFIIKVLNNDIK